MSRSVAEWIGRDDDSAIPPRVRMRVFGKYHGRCYKCDHRIAAGERWTCDHIIALINGGTNAENNLGPLCFLCDKRKTAADLKEKSKVARVRAKHLGLKKQRTIRTWRNFSGDIVIAPRDRANPKRKILYARDR